MLDHPSAAFLATLFGPSGPPDGTFAQLWDASRSYTHNVTTWNQAAAVVSVGRTKDVYVGVGLSPKKIPHASRLRQGDCAGIPGVWLDVDVVGGPTNRSSAAPDKGAAADLAASILEPSLLVDSGYGMQAWWLFDGGPWMLAGDDDRLEARRLEAGCIQAHRSKVDWKIDSVHDLARLMRLPGTMNGKDSRHHQPVAVLHEGPRYARGRLVDAFGFGELGANLNGTEVALGFELGQVGVDPIKLAALVAESPRFAAVFGERLEEQREQWSASECDFSLAVTALRASWTHMDVASLIAAHRQAHHPEVADKALRRDYIERTISNAEAALVADKKTDQRIRTEAASREEALTLLEREAVTPPENPDDDSDRIRRMALFNTIITGDRETAPKFVRILQQGLDRDAVYTLVTDAGQQIVVGVSAQLLRPDSLAEVLMPALGFVMPEIKRGRWRAALSAVMQIAEVAEHPEETRQGQLAETIRAYAARHGGFPAEDAKAMRFPFVEGGLQYVNITGLLTWGKNADLLPRTMHTTDLAAGLHSLGMERHRTTVEKADGGRKAGPWYYRGVVSQDP